MKTSVFQSKATALQSSPYNMERQLLEHYLTLESLVGTSVGHRMGPLSGLWSGHQWATGRGHYQVRGQDISGPQGLSFPS